METLRQPFSLVQIWLANQFWKHWTRRDNYWNIKKYVSVPATGAFPSGNSLAGDTLGGDQLSSPASARGRAGRGRQWLLWRGRMSLCCISSSWKQSGDPWTMPALWFILGGWKLCFQRGSLEHGLDISWEVLWASWCASYIMRTAFLASLTWMETQALLPDSGGVGWFFCLFLLGSSCFIGLFGECMRLRRGQGAWRPLPWRILSLLPTLLLKDAHPNKCLILRVGPYSDLSISVSQHADLVVGAVVFLEVS